MAPCRIIAGHLPANKLLITNKSLLFIPISCTALVRLLQSCAFRIYPHTLLVRQYKVQSNSHRTMVTSTRGTCASGIIRYYFTLEPVHAHGANSLVGIILGCALVGNFCAISRKYVTNKPGNAMAYFSISLPKTRDCRVGMHINYYANRSRCNVCI